MGCDIHMYAEQRDEKGDWQPIQVWENEAEEGDEYEYWCAHPSLPSDRNYYFFGFLANVRRETGINRQALSLPEDACDEIKRAGNDIDWHTHSYISLTGLKEAVADFGDDPESKARRLLKGISVEGGDEGLDNLHQSANSLIQGLEALPKFIAGREQRFVFWFDN